MKPDQMMREIDAVISRGPFSDDWDSLTGFQVPDWYVNGKFGIFIHWGVYSVPAFGTEWYPRNMYVEGSAEFEHHVTTYGPHREFGYRISSHASRQGVAINHKFQAFPEGTAVYDLERGQLRGIRPLFWQTDTSVSRNSWGYVENHDYKEAGGIIHDLVDIVSKNGALLLNIGPKSDGTIPEQEMQMLREIGSWLRVNGEAIYGTRPWTVFGEGRRRWWRDRLRIRSASRSPARTSVSRRNRVSFTQPFSAYPTMDESRSDRWGRI